MSYDTIIIGAGPAGLTAGVYAGRGMLKTLILERGGIGGQIATSWEIENYPGAPPESTGPALTERMREQCVEFGVEFKTGIFNGFEKQSDHIRVKTENGDLLTKTLILATGSEPSMIGCKGEVELRGMGVSYCATCDANFFKNMKVAVIGGGNTALEEALFLTKYASSVTVIHRRNELRGAKILQNRVRDHEKIDFLLDSVVEEIIGNAYVEAIKVKNLITDEVETIPMDGVFVFVGQKPNTEGFEGLLKQNDHGYLLTDDEMRTDIEGVFAAGDIRQKSLRQVVTATGDGAIAASNAIKFIEG
ncbi:thioredoxin-disulfide reductase [Eubacteriaceae bacterium ES3]|nr:thioredoxin-disulfide reductase [Eubacteriaceae bacterium ES3]